MLTRRQTTRCRLKSSCAQMISIKNLHCFARDPVKNFVRIIKLKEPAGMARLFALCDFATYVLPRRKMTRGEYLVTY
jgi:hypothetical protein